MSRTFSTRRGSCDSRTDSVRCGCSPNARQIRPIDEWLNPTFFAMERVLQCVRPRGVDSRVLVTTASTASSVIERTAPRTWLVVEPVEALRYESGSPFADAPTVNAQLATDVAIRLPLGAAQNNLGPERHLPTAPRSRSQALKRGAFIMGQRQNFALGSSSARHPTLRSCRLDFVDRSLLRGTSSNGSAGQTRSAALHTGCVRSRGSDRTSEP